MLTGYGGYSLIYNLNKDRGLSVLTLIFLCLGTVLFLIYFGLVTYDLSKRYEFSSSSSSTKILVEVPLLFGSY